MTDPAEAPLLLEEFYDAASEFTADTLLREACRQKCLPRATVPSICVLDPDGDMVRYLRAARLATANATWACYHSELYRFADRGQEFGIVGCAVGASYAVLVAEQMLASGCEILVSIASSGEITPLGPPPYFILIERALRDEGTSYHYLAPAEYAETDKALIDAI